MSRINTNVSSLIAQRVLRKNNDSLNTSLERLSTGLKINKGSDNPAGLIASENLRAEKAGIAQAIENAGRASNIVGTAEGGLSEVSSLLTELQNLVSQTANSGGLSNEASFDGASVSGGDNNLASGVVASVSGGRFNEASARGASVSGGVFNEASGGAASVSGGSDNIANHDDSTVSGGVGNATAANGDHVP